MSKTNVFWTALACSSALLLFSCAAKPSAAENRVSSNLRASQDAAPTPQAAPAQAGAMPVYYDYALPEKLDLCGEPVPLHDPAVREMLDREFTINVWDQAQVFMWLKRAARAFPVIEAELKNRGLPDDIKYLAVAESALLSHARSGKGAVGAWQFIPDTGSRYGLRNDANFDYRLHFERSTRAALDYLQKLYADFGSWSLAMAAYNCGEGRIASETALQRVRDYYYLNLPLETERYIFRILAIKLILSDPARYGYILPPEHAYQSPATERVEVSIARPVSITDLALALGSTYKQFKDMNPEILGRHLPAGTYAILVPQGTGKKARKTLASLAGRSAAAAPAAVSSGKKTGRVHVVRPGESLTGISRKTGVPVARIRSLNGIRGQVIKIGQKLRLE
jgi:soluble lytic murein transglycosylase-like protein